MATNTAEEKEGGQFGLAQDVGLAIVTNHTNKSGVSEGRKFLVTESGIQFQGKMTIDQWTDLMRSLRLIRGSWDLCMGTAVRYGIEQYGKEQVDTCLKQLEFDYQDGTRAMALGQCELDFSEYTGLTAEHYFILTICFPENKEEQAKWAKLAVEHSLTPVLLKYSIKKGEVLTQEEQAQHSGKGSGGLGFLDSLSMAFHQWERRIGGHDAVLKLDAEKRQRWLESVSPIRDLAREVEESLKS